MTAEPRTEPGDFPGRRQDWGGAEPGVRRRGLGRALLASSRGRVPPLPTSSRRRLGQGAGPGARGRGLPTSTAGLARPLFTSLRQCRGGAEPGLMDRGLGGASLLPPRAGPRPSLRPSVALWQGRGLGRGGGACARGASFAVRYQLASFPGVRRLLSVASKWTG